MTGTSSIAPRQAWTIIGVIFVQWLIGYFDKTAVSVLAVPISEEFGFSRPQMGMVLSGFFLGFAAMTPVGGYLADRFGPRRVLFLVMLLWSVFTGLTMFAWSLVSLIAVRALFGMAEGSFPAASSAAVARLMPVEKRGRAKALLMSGASLGTALGAFLVAAMAHAWGWRAPFVIFALIGVVVSVAFLAASGPMKQADRQAVNRKPEGRMRAVMASPLVWLLASAQFGIGFFAWGLNQWMPSYWVEVKGLNLSMAGVATAIPNLVSFVAMIATGVLADRLVGREGRFISVCMLVAMIATGLTYIAPTVVLGVIAIGVAQVAIFCCAPLLAIVVLKRMEGTVVGTATGLTNFGQQFAGVVAPTVMGFAIEAAGGSYGVIFGLVIAILAAAALISLAIDKVRPGALAAQVP